MEHEASGQVINVGTGIATPVDALVDTMIEVSGRQLEKLYEPPDWTAGSYRVGNVEAIERTIGWRATTSLRDGLERTFRWLATAAR
jgi:nucleoside-diphosphate-sugar epimerase